MDLGLKDKVVIVTGGAANIGRTIAHTFAKEGAKVTITDWDEKQAIAMITEAKGMGLDIKQIPADVTNWDQVQAMANKVKADTGRIDILVNNVGWDIVSPFMTQTRDFWEKVVNINFWGVINCTRAVLDTMIEQKKGSIVTIASDAGRMGEFGEAVYGGCKAGVICITKSLERELGKHGIRLNNVCPGMTPPGASDEIGEKSLWKDMFTALTPDKLEKAAKAYPLRKLGKPQDIADAVVFMASDRAGHIAGQTLSVSGGYTMM
ncbi:MAG: SDR family oxidoreductase [Syntrophales bacterium]